MFNDKFLFDINLLKLLFNMSPSKFLSDMTSSKFLFDITSSKFLFNMIKILKFQIHLSDISELNNSFVQYFGANKLFIYYFRTNNLFIQYDKIKNFGANNFLLNKQSHQNFCPDTSSSKFLSNVRSMKISVQHKSCST